MFGGDVTTARKAAAGARPRRGLKEGLDAALARARGIEVSEHGPLGWWITGDAAAVEAVAGQWAAAVGSPVRLYSVEAAVNRSHVHTSVRGWTLAATGERRELPAVTDDDETEWDGETSASDMAAERLAIALEMFEELHHEDHQTYEWTG